MADPENTGPWARIDAALLDRLRVFLATVATAHPRDGEQQLFCVQAAELLHLIDQQPRPVAPPPLRLVRRTDSG